MLSTPLNDDDFVQYYLYFFSFTWVLFLLYSVCIGLLQLLSLEEPWTLIIDDALANSFVAPVTDDIKNDSQLTCEFSVLFPNGIMTSA